MLLKVKNEMPTGRMMSNRHPVVSTPKSRAAQPALATRKLVYLKKPRRPRFVAMLTASHRFRSRASSVTANWRPTW